MDRLRNKLFSRSNLGTTSIWLALFLAFGYPFSVAVPILFHLPSEAINIAFRIVYVLLSLYIIIGSLIKNDSRYISQGSLFILIFWALYSFRLIYDVSYREIIFNSTFYVYSFAFGNCLLPSIAFIWAGKYIQPEQLKKTTVKFLILLNLVTLILLASSLGGLSAESLSRRVMISDANDESKLMLNGITISYTGEVLSVVSLALLLFSRESKKGILYLSLPLGLFNLMIGASRGPMLSFLFCTLLMVFYLLAKMRRTSANLIKILGCGIALVTFYFVLFKSFLENSNISIIFRLLNLFEGGQSSSLDERPLLFKSAWHQFLASPILGDQYLSSFDNFYPHNIYLEVLMALGMVGGLIFLAIVVFSMRKASILVKEYQENIFIPFILLITLLLAGMTSGSLFSGVGLWTWLSLFNSLHLHKEHAITHRLVRL